ncbi:non-specific lipid-transfer protein-like protein At2g13820 [Durio zibethinus]|uniref:Non-specific lipid-transfer protein-like protein At2g13820 n=1 Tax=Durio zibethinus TaxID=66656 RepID=A0A6P6A406_DURZI|nr:non-specific lipid-transfer protein-like protein At2g13820 [Durio zibethinus]
MGMVWTRANAQSCTSTLTSLAPCLNYITGNSSTPSSTCCSQLKTVVQSSPQCLCSAFNSGASLGNGNYSNWTQLPGSYQVQTPSINQCNGGTSSTPETLPAASPTGSPSDPSDKTPSASDIPSGTGSKSVPWIDGESSDASIAKASLHSVLFLLLIATVTKF